MEQDLDLRLEILAGTLSDEGRKDEAQTIRDTQDEMRRLQMHLASQMEEHIVLLERQDRRLSVMEEAKRAPWPAGCLKPRSCARHLHCMYAQSPEQCRYFGKNLSDAVEAAQERAANI